MASVCSIDLSEWSRWAAALRIVDPYDEANAPRALPKPRTPLHKIGVKRWHHDLSIRIIEAAIDGRPDQVALDWHAALRRPAAMRYPSY